MQTKIEEDLGNLNQYTFHLICGIRDLFASLIWNTTSQFQGKSSSWGFQVWGPSERGDLWSSRCGGFCIEHKFHLFSCTNTSMHIQIQKCNSKTHTFKKFIKWSMVPRMWWVLHKDINSTIHILSFPNPGHRREEEGKSRVRQICIAQSWSDMKVKIYDKARH